MPIELYPPGTIVPFGGGTVPAGWLLCNGQSVTTAGRADLFAEIGYTYGGSGANFNVPDLRDRFPLGKAAAGTGSTLGGTGGTLNHTHTTANHSHGATQADPHDDHNIEGGHNHNSHTLVGIAVGVASGASTPTNHAGEGGHNHDAHTAHVNMSIATNSGSVTTGTNNPAFQVFDFIIASYNTFTRSFSNRHEHRTTHAIRFRHTFPNRHEHKTTHTLRFRHSFNNRHEHKTTMTRVLVLKRTFNVRSEHKTTHLLRFRHSFANRHEHRTTHLLRVRKAAFNVRSEHVMTHLIRFRRTFNVRSEHKLARPLILFRHTFANRHEHLMSFTRILTIVRTLNVRSEHLVTGRICLAFEDVPSGTGGTTIIRPIFIFDD